MRRLVVVLATVGIALVAIAGPAWAHVEIEPSSAPKGSDAVLTFVVPNEESNTTTKQVAVQFPQDHPIADAAVLAMPGWKSEVKTKKLTTPVSTDSGNVDEGVDTVTWTATGAGIGAGEFAEFKVSVGLPDVEGPLSFPAIQTYGNGDVVRWIEQTTPGAAEPDHPAPVLTLTAGDSATTSKTATTTSSSSSSDDTGKTLGIIGIIVGAVGVVLGAIALAATRRKSSPSTS